MDHATKPKASRARIFRLLRKLLIPTFLLLILGFQATNRLMAIIFPPPNNYQVVGALFAFGSGSVVYDSQWKDLDWNSVYLFYGEGPDLSDVFKEGAIVQIPGGDDPKKYSSSQVWGLHLDSYDVDYPVIAAQAILAGQNEFAVPRRMDDTGLGLIGTLTDLRYLSLERMSFENATEKGWQNFAKLKNLKVLLLNHTGLSDEKLSDIANFKDLEALRIDSTKIADAGLQKISQLRNLRLISISGCSQVTDKGLESLSQLPNLQLLDISACSGVTDKGMESLEKMKKLQGLRIFYTKISDEGLARIKSLDNLRVLELGGEDRYHKVLDIPIKAKGFHSIKTLPKLEDLVIWPNASITDESLDPLKGMTHLKRLIMHDWDDTVKVTRQGMESLRKAMPQTEVTCTIHSPTGGGITNY